MGKLWQVHTLCVSFSLTRLSKHMFSKHLLFHLLVNCLPLLQSPKPLPPQHPLLSSARWHLRWGFCPLWWVIQFLGPSHVYFHVNLLFNFLLLICIMLIFTSLDQPEESEKAECKFLPSQQWTEFVVSLHSLFQIGSIKIVFSLSFENNEYGCFCLCTIKYYILYHFR